MRFLAKDQFLSLGRNYSVVGQVMYARTVAEFSPGTNKREENVFQFPFIVCAEEKVAFLPTHHSVSWVCCETIKEGREPL